MQFILMREKTQREARTARKQREKVKEAGESQQWVRGKGREIKDDTGRGTGKECVLGKQRYF